MKKKYVAEVARKWREKSLERKAWRLRWQPVCASTELELSRWLREEQWKGTHPWAVLASKQNHGTGQFGRAWQSPKGGVWMSAAIPWSIDQKSSGVLGLSVAVALAERLEQCGLPVRIKWPNDLLVYGRKLAGFLPKLVHRGSNVRLARIGIGLNVCNRVPIEGISLSELLNPSKSLLVNWTSEVLCVLERSSDIAMKSAWVCHEAERRLWANYFWDSNSGDYWRIDGLSDTGELVLGKGSQRKKITRW